ncbi:hypothetical protein ACJRO7_006775 [Eucalyptus globulus]|uniref:Clathrin light chain n=1 Tax=Eucalyptus globulus TaxID=34317 RepID=A0ABD3IJ21_EUCGL
MPVDPEAEESPHNPDSQGHHSGPFHDGAFMGYDPTWPPPMTSPPTPSLPPPRRATKREKEMRYEVIAEAEEYKRAFYEKRKLNCETYKLYLAKQEKFHKEADKHYWKAIVEIIPQEVPNVENGGKRDAEKSHRMRQVLSMLKQHPPPHMMPSPAPLPTKDGKDSKGREQDERSGKIPLVATSGDGAGGEKPAAEKPPTPPKVAADRGESEKAEVPEAPEGEKAAESRAAAAE